MKKRNFNRINKVIVHCSDSGYDHHDYVKVIDDWHKIRFKPDPDGVYCGYHFFVQKNGNIQIGRKLEWYGQHCRGENYSSIGICLHGLSGEFTQDQMKAIIEKIIDLKIMIPTIIRVGQHSDYDKRKPHCAGLSKSAIKYLNSLVC